MVANPNDTFDTTLIDFFMFFGSVLCTAVFVYRTGNLRVLICHYRRFHGQAQIATDPSGQSEAQSPLILTAAAAAGF